MVVFHNHGEREVLLKQWPFSALVIQTDFPIHSAFDTAAAAASAETLVFKPMTFLYDADIIYE